MNDTAPDPHPAEEQPAAPQVAAPQYAAPQYAAPQVAAPQVAAPQVAAPQYAANWAPAPGPGEPFDGATDPHDLSRPLYGATLGQAIARFFRGYVRFDGRASLSEYWFARLFLAMLMLGWVLGTAIVLSLPESAGRPAAGAWIALGILATLGLALPSIASMWRRLHDANFPGPLWFLTFAPAGDLVLLVLMLMRSRPEGRRFDAASQGSFASPTGPASGR